MLEGTLRYSEVIRARAPKELRDAVERAALRELSTSSAYARKAILNQLRADGFAPSLSKSMDLNYGS
jgi:hypothetical protein